MTAADTKHGRGTVMLVSGELDKALAAFEVALGMQAMGVEMSMWFVMFGVNCLRKPRCAFLPSKWLRRPPAGPGRRPQTDSPLQRLVGALGHDGANHLPLSQLNFLGLGPLLLRRIMKRKGMASLSEMIEQAQELGVRFVVCQTCIDALGFSVTDDLVVPAEVKGVSAYHLAAQAAHYNATF